MTTLVQEIKKQYSILTLARDEVLRLKPVRPQGWYVGACPFYKHRKPRTFWIDARPGRGLCSCFVPQCAAHNPGRKPMDVINFYARLHNISNRAAIFELADILGLLDKDDYADDETGLREYDYAH